MSIMLYGVVGGVFVVALLTRRKFMAKLSGKKPVPKSTEAKTAPSVPTLPEAVVPTMPAAEVPEISEATVPTLPEVPEKVVLAIVDGKAPSGYEFYAGAFPRGSAIDLDDQVATWTGGGWQKNGHPCAVNTKHRYAGAPGTPFEGFIFIWNADGSLGGHWIRPIKK